MREVKTIKLPGVPGECIVPVSTEDDPHEFGLYDKDGNELHTSYFKNMERAIERASEEFPGEELTVKDLTEAWYVKIAMEYRKRIKKLCPGLKTSQIILDMSNIFYSRNPNSWYTCIPFNYHGTRWTYRETADGSEWVEKVKGLSKAEGSLDNKIKNVQKIANKSDSMKEKEYLER